MRAPKLCSRPNCPNKQPCPTHQRKPWEGSTRRQRLPRGWARLRLSILSRDPICQVCLQAMSTEVDHIKPGDDHRQENLQGICKRCHRTKSAHEGARGRGATP